MKFINLELSLISQHGSTHEPPSIVWIKEGHVKHAKISGKSLMALHVHFLLYLSDEIALDPI